MADTLPRWSTPHPRHLIKIWEAAGGEGGCSTGAWGGGGGGGGGEWQPMVKGRASLWGRDTSDVAAVTSADPIKDGYVYTDPAQLRQIGANAAHGPPLNPMLPAAAGGAGLLLGLYLLLRGARGWATQRWKATLQDPKQTDSSPKSGAVGGFVAGVATDLVGVDRGDLTAALADVQGKEARLAKAQALVKEMRAKAGAMQRRLKQQLEEREGELRLAVQTARALEAEVEAVGRVVAAQEAEIDAVQAAAAEHSIAAQGALDESQRRVALLEAMVSTLRGQLHTEEERSAGLAGQVAEGEESLRAANSRIAELEGRISTLEDDLSEAEARWRGAAAEAERLANRSAALEAEGGALRGRISELEKAATREAAAAADVAASVEKTVASLEERAAAAEASVSSLEEELKSATEELRAAEDEATAAMASKVAEMAKLEANYRAEAEAAAKALAERESEARTRELELNEAYRRLRDKEEEVAEVQRSAATAAEEANAAREALSLRSAEIAELEAGLSAAQRELEESQAEGSETVQRLKTEVARRAAELGVAQAVVAEERGAREAKEREVATKEAALAKAQHLVAQRETELEAVRSLVRVRDLNMKETAARVREGEGMVATLREAVAERETAVERLQSMVRQRERAVEAAEREAALAQEQAEEEAKLRMREVESVRAELQPAVAAARAQLEKQRAELTSMRESYEERLAALTAEVEAANKDKATREEDEERQATLRNALRKARKEVEMLEGLLAGVLDETRAYLGPGEKARDEELGREAKALRAQLSETGSEESKAIEEKLAGIEGQRGLLLQAVMPGELLQKERRLKQQLATARAAEAEVAAEAESAAGNGGAQAAFLQAAMEEVATREAALAQREAALKEAERSAAASTSGKGTSAEQAQAMQDAVTGQLKELRAFQQEMKAQKEGMKKMREKYEAEVGSAKSAAREAAEEAEALRKEMATRDAELAEFRAGMPNAAALMMSALEAEAMLQAAVRSETETRPAKPPIAEVNGSNGAPAAELPRAPDNYKSLNDLSDALWGSKPATAPSPSPRPPAAAPASVPPAAPRPSKPTPAQGKLLGLKCGGFVIPHPSKVEKGGEDAFFASPAEPSSAPLFLGAVGVADGVGGWTEDGIDPAAYARVLMENCELAAGPPSMLSPQQVLDDAHLLTELPGSATAVVGVLREGGRLSVANLGDCGFRVVRGSGAVVKSRPQQHEFNMPYQLAWASVLPDTDTAMDAQLYELEVAAEDVLVFGSDGLFDNMWDEQLMSIVQNFTRETARPRSNEDAMELARRLTEAATENSASSEYRSPWAVAAAEAGAVPLFSRLFPRGGKLDDTTVVVAFLEDMGSEQ